MNYRKSLVILAMLLLLTASLAACGGSPTSPVTEENKPDEMYDEPTHLYIASRSGWIEDAFNETFGNDLRAKFPQHTFTFLPAAGKPQYYEELIAGGQQIDIIWDSMAFFVTYEMQAGLQMDMSELLKKHQVDVSPLETSMVGAMRAVSDGGIYALPVVYNTQLLYYNKDIFERFGVAYPKDGMTWEEVLELNRRLTRLDQGVQYVGLGVNSVNHFRQSPLSLPYIDMKTEKPTINNGQWDTVYNVLKTMAEAPGYRERMTESKGLLPETGFYKDRNVAMFVNLANTHLIREGHDGFNWDVVSYPTYKEAPGVAPQASPTVFGVAATSPHKDQAMQVVKYLLSEPFQIQVAKRGTLPVMRSSAVLNAYGQETRFGDKNIKVAFTYNNAPIVTPTIYNNALQGRNVAKLTDFLLGKVDLNTLKRVAEEEGIQEIAKLKQQ